jgi:peptide/nickel transport system substrate-binding protein
MRSPLKKVRTVKILLHLSILACLAFAGCTTQQARGLRHGHDTLVVAIRQEPIALNPLLLEGTTSYTIGPLLYSYLTNYDAKGNAAGDLAIAAPSLANGGVSPGGTRITYHLRRGMRWEDGTPITAADVLFTYHAVMNPANNVPERYTFDLITSIAAPDPYTVVITTKHPFAPIIGYFFGGDSNYQILPAHLLAQYANLNAVPFNATPIGSGPYRLERWDRGDRLVLAANSAFHAGKPAIDHLVLPFVQQDSTTINELQSGDVDAAFLLDASRVHELRAIPNHRVVVTPVPYFYALAYNFDDPLLADAAIRKAIGLAIDRESLTRKITQGTYRARTAMAGLFTWAYDPGGDTERYDPAAAAAMLARDGWMPGPDGIRVKDGKRLHLELAFPAGSDITTRFATAIAAEVRAVGIDLSQRSYDRNQFIANDGPVMQGRYQVSLYDYQATWDPDASWLLACNQKAPHGFNLARYCDPAIDVLLQRAASSFERATRIADSRAIERLVAQDQPYYFICQISEVDVLPSSLDGFEAPLLSPFNSVARWRWGSPTTPAD